MSDLEKFIHDQENHFPDLLKIALVHYQFETIHPFLDGNGRVGRLMIPLYLVSKGILKKPVLYLSDFLEKHRDYYYENLMRVRDKNDLKKWLKFFLAGIIETCENGIKTFDDILQLQKKVNDDIQTLGSRTSKAKIVVDYLYKRPIINAEKLADITELSMPTAYSLIVQLEELDILKEITGG